MLRRRRIRSAVTTLDAAWCLVCRAGTGQSALNLIRLSVCWIGSWSVKYSPKTTARATQKRKLLSELIARTRSRDLSSALSDDSSKRARCFLWVTFTSGPTSIWTMTYEPPSLTVHSILDALLTGASVEELQPRINALPIGECATLLCSTCAMIDELVIIYRDVSVEVARVLIRNCRFFEPGNVLCHATCERDYAEPPTA